MLRTKMAKRRSPKLVAVLSVTRHERVQIGRGRWANENQYPLSMKGFARAVRHGERFIEVLKRNPRAWKEIKKKGLFYTGIASPMQRTVETDRSNFTGFHAKLADEGIRLHGHYHVKSPSLEFIKIDRRLRGYPKTRKAKQNVLQKLKQYEAGKQVHGFEPKEHLRSRMAQVAEVASAFREHGKELAKGSPVFFLNFVSHGGAKEIPLQVDYAVEALTGKKKPHSYKALQRGQSLIQLLYSNGSRKNIVLRK